MNKLDSFLKTLATDETADAVSVVRKLVKAKTEGLPLRPFQEDALAHALVWRRSLMGLEMGLGKTPVAISAIHSATNAGLRPSLVVVPPSLRTNWLREFGKFAPELTVHTITGRTPYELPDVDVFISGDANMNEDWANTLKGHVQGLVIDEGHRMKNHKTQRAQAVMSIARGVPSDGLIMPMSGTFTTNGRPTELVTSLHIVNRMSDLVTGKKDAKWSMGHQDSFLNRYAPRINSWGGRGADRLVELNEKLVEHAGYYRKLRDDVLAGTEDELPNKGRSLWYAEGAPKKAVKRYELAEEDLRAYLMGERGYSESQVVKSFRAEALTRLNTLRREAGLLKIEATVARAKELLTESDDERIFIATGFRQEADLIAERMSGKDVQVVKIVGGMSDKAKTASVDAFTEGDARVLVGNINASGVGFTLHGGGKCRHMILHSMNFVPADLLQVEDRLHRFGQTRECISTIAIATLPSNVPTIDEHIYNILEAKYGGLSEILDGVEDRKLIGNLEGSVIDELLNVYKSDNYIS